MKKPSGNRRVLKYNNFVAVMINDACADVDADDDVDVDDGASDDGDSDAPDGAV